MVLSLLKVGNGNRLERIWLLAKIEFKLRYYENKLGLVWALLKPLSQLIVYFIAFKIVIRNNIPNFAIYLFNGLIVWQFFIESTIGLLAILRTKRYLYEYSNMSKIEIYLASLISVSLGFFFNLGILILILLVAGINIGFPILYLPILFILLFVFCLGSAILLSNLFLIAKDIGQVWPLLTQLLLWLSPIFFSAEALKRSIPLIDVFNPMFGMITNFRNIVMYNQAPDLKLLLISIIHTIIILIIGSFMLKKLGNKAPEML